DVAFRDLESAVEAVDAGCGVSDGKEVDMIPGEEAAVNRFVLVLADGNDDDIGHQAMELDEAGKLFDAGRAPGGPQVKDDGMAAEFAQLHRLDVIAYGKVRRDDANLLGMTSAVAPGDQ